MGKVETFGNITLTTTTCDCYADYNLTTITLQKDVSKSYYDGVLDIDLIWTDLLTHVSSTLLTLISTIVQQT